MWGLKDRLTQATLYRSLRRQEQYKVHRSYRVGCDVLVALQSKLKLSL